MADHHDFSRPAEEALSRLFNFRAQNPPSITIATVGYSPSPSPGLPSPSMSPTFSTPQLSPPTPSVPNFQPSRMAIPSTAYAAAYTSASSSTGHMPVIGTQSPSPRAYEPQVYPEPLESLTYHMVYDRVYLVLRDNLTEWWTKNPEALHHVAYRVTTYVVANGVRGVFGPDGLYSLYQISMYIGRDGIYSYMCLAVQSGFGGLTVLLKGDLCEKDRKDPMYDEEMLALVKDGFDKGAAKLYSIIVAEASKT